MLKILYKLATRSRREKAVKAIENIIEFNPKGEFAILLSIDTDDESMKDFQHDSKSVIIKRGLSKNKIDAINQRVITDKAEKNKDISLLDSKGNELVVE
jgi:hypothetical protein